MSAPGRPPTPLLRRIRRAVGRALRVGTGRRMPAPRDPFAAMRPIDGPVLVPSPRIEPDPDPRREPHFVVLVPRLELGRMTGGPNTAINIAVRFAARGHPVQLVATHSGVDADVAALRAHAAALGGTDAGDHITFATCDGPGGVLRLGRRDVLMATYWPTAHIARSALSMTDVREFIYLVQDYEPAFYPWSTSYALAAQTYGFPVRAIFNESFVRDHVVSVGGGRFGSAGLDRIAIAFEPAVDRGLFRSLPRSGPKRLLFYARPNNPRNAFELGLRSLRRAAEIGAFGPDWEVASIGNQVPDLPLDAARTIRAIPWQSMPAYAELLGRSDVLLSLMLSPHTSYPPLEMAATGGAVVTNTFGIKSEAALHRISPAIRAVEPEVETLAAAIADATAEADARRAGPVAPLALPGDWGEALDPVVDWLEATVVELRST